MRCGIHQPQPAAPGAADHQPAVYAQMGSQSLHVMQQMGRGVGMQGLVGCAAPAAALVKQNHPCGRWIEQLAVFGAATAAGPAV